MLFDCVVNLWSAMCLSTLFFMKMVPFNTSPIKFCISFDMEVKFMTCCRVQGQELFLMRTLRKRPQVLLNSVVYYQLKLEPHCQFI